MPDHLRITFRVVDEHDQPLGEGKDLAALRQRLAPKVREQFAEAATGLERAGLTAWDVGALPPAIERTIAGHTVTAYPSLVDEGDSVAIRVFDRPERQDLEMWAGVRRLLLLGLPSPAKFVQGRLSNAAKLALSRNPHRSAVDLLDDCAACAVDHLMADPQHPGRLGLSTWDEAGFAALRERVRADLVEVTLDVVTTVQRILAAAYEVEQRLSRTGNPVLLPALTDLRQQLGRLVFRGFVTATGWDRLPDLERYLQGMQRRLDKLPSDPGRDRERMMTVQQVQQEYDQLAASMSDRPELREIRWMIEELRVGLFAQALGTRYPISDVRIYRAMDQL